MKYIYYMLAFFIATALSDKLFIMFPKQSVSEIQLRPVQAKARNNPGKILGRTQFYDTDGCTKLPTNKHQIKTSILPLTVVLVGLNCGLRTKISNAQAIGATSLIVLTQSEQVKGGRSIRDFTILLADPQQKSKFEKYNGRDQQDLITQLIIDRKDQQKQEKLQLQVWGAAYNYDTYNLYNIIIELLETYPTFKNHIKIMPKFALIDCTDTATSCSRSYKEACVCKGKLCSVAKNGMNQLKYIEQDLKMMAIYKKGGISKFLDYIAFFGKECLQFGCQDSVLEEGLGYNLSFVDKYIEQVQNCEGLQFQELERERDFFASIHMFPVLQINQKLSNALNVKQLRDDLCIALTKQQIQVEGCRYVQSKSIWSYWMVIIIVGIVVIGAFLIYRQRHTKEMRKNMALEINSAVSNYFRFAQKK